MKLIKKDSCGVIIGKIARGALATTIIGTVAISLSISCNRKYVKPHVDLADTNGQIVYCVDNEDELFIKTIGYDVLSNCVVISDYLTGRVIAVTSDLSIEQYKKNNNLYDISDEELYKKYLSSILRKECVEVEPISSYIDNVDEDKVTKYELKNIINNIDENPELYLESKISKIKVK